VSLFAVGRFNIHTGLPDDFKIDCDYLTTEDYEALAFLGSRCVKFSHVIGIYPGSETGIDNGGRFAQAMLPYASSGPILIVDDVYTTGNSMFQTRCMYPGAIGLVIFTRRKLPDWVKALFWQLVST